MAKRRAHLIISGRVQGVCYRAFTKDVAVSRGLTGWVKNLPDGRVEAVLEGESDSIERAVAECYKGPPASHVTDIAIEWEEFKGEFSGFDIGY